MSTLTKAHDELFRRRPDECFSSVESLIQHCRNEHRESQDRWHLPARLQPTVVGGELSFSAGDDGEFILNDWSFSQICRLSGVAKETVNRLSPDTARAVLRETLPHGAKPMQILTTGPAIRSIHVHRRYPSERSRRLNIPQPHITTTAEPPLKIAVTLKGYDAAPSKLPSQH